MPIFSGQNFKVNEKNVVLDCDGVLLDFDRSFRKVGIDILGRTLTPVLRAYDLKNRYGLTSNELNNIWSAMDDHPHGWKNLPVFEGAIEAALQLKAQGLSVHLVTGIPEHLAESRLLNLALHGLEPDSIHCVGGGGSPKVEKMKMFSPFMFVDDRLHLLHESPFVPYRVWVDLDQEQNGFVQCEEVIHVKSLEQWVRQWMTSEGLSYSDVEKINPYTDWESARVMDHEKKIHPLSECVDGLPKPSANRFPAHKTDGVAMGSLKGRSGLRAFETLPGLPRFAGTKGGFRP